MKKNEKITVTNDGDHWVCPCGNNTMGSGFDTCDNKGLYTEPFEGVWFGLYACQECGRIIDQNSYEVVFRVRDLSSFDIIPSKKLFL